MQGDNAVWFFLLSFTSILIHHNTINQIALGVHYVTMATLFCTVKNKTPVLLLKFGESKNLIAWQFSPWENWNIGKGDTATLYWRVKMKSNHRDRLCLLRQYSWKSEASPLQRCTGIFHHRHTGGFPGLRLGSLDKHLLHCLANLWGGKGKKSMQKAGWEL